MQARRTRRRARAAGRPRRAGAASGWAIGIIVIALFGVAGAAVASGQFAPFTASAIEPAGIASATARPAESPAVLAPTTPATTTPTASPTPTAVPSAPAAPPVSPAETPCAASVTMSIWAHYDDDLIFANPALQQAMDGGDCIRTVFVTASDAGRGSGYSEKRELGILRAYNSMRGQQGLWSPTAVTLLSGAVLTQWSPDGEPRVTVAFLRLPDGGVTGDGFAATGGTSLSQMLNGAIPAMWPIDGRPAISSETLVASLAETMQAYHATRLLTHVPGTAVNWTAGDHPDHAATGSYARSAWQRAGLVPAQVSYAIGYPTASLPANVSGEELSRKLAPYRIYAAQDAVVSCDSDQACLAKPRFGDWLQRHYLQSDAELFLAG